MDHDPLCVCSRRDHAHWFMDDPQICMCCGCDTIREVRADERAKGMAEDRWISAREAREYEADIRADEREQAARRVEAQSSSFRARDWDDAIAAAAAAARGEE